MLTVKERSLRIGTLPTATLQFTNLTLTNLGVSPDLHGGSKVTNRPNHDTALGKI
jgi:hypothetical protein